MERSTIDYPEGLETAVATTRSEFEAQVRLMAALKMFELGKLSSGKAARLAGMSRVEFFEMCGRYHVPVVNYSSEELETELEQDISVVRGRSGPPSLLIQGRSLPWLKSTN